MDDEFDIKDDALEADDDLPPVTTDDEGEVVEPKESEDPFDHGFGDPEEML